MARNSYTFRTEWTAYAELDDFKRIKEAQDLVLHETEHKPKERHLISALVTNLLSTSTAAELAAKYIQATKASKDAAAAAKAEEERQRKADELAMAKLKVKQLERELAG